MHCYVRHKLSVTYYLFVLFFCWQTWQGRANVFITRCMRAMCALMYSNCFVLEWEPAQHLRSVMRVSGRTKTGCADYCECVRPAKTPRLTPKDSSSVPLATRYIPHRDHTGYNKAA
jgi:hypothetical protein